MPNQATPHAPQVEEAIPLQEMRQNRPRRSDHEKTRAENAHDRRKEERRGESQEGDDENLYEMRPIIRRRGKIQGEMGFKYLEIAFKLRTRNSIRGFVRPSVRGHESKRGKTSILEVFLCMGMGLDAPAHPSATIL